MRLTRTKDMKWLKKFLNKEIKAEEVNKIIDKEGCKMDKGGIRQFDNVINMVKALSDDETFVKELQEVINKRKIIQQITAWICPQDKEIFKFKDNRWLDFSDAVPLKTKCIAKKHCVYCQYDCKPQKIRIIVEEV